MCKLFSGHGPVSFSADGNFIAFGSNGNIMVVEMESDRIVLTTELNGESCALSEKGDWLAAAERESIEVWNARTREYVESINRDKKCIIHAGSADGRFLLVSDYLAATIIEFPTGRTRLTLECGKKIAFLVWLVILLNFL